MIKVIVAIGILFCAHSVNAEQIKNLVYPIGQSVTFLTGYGVVVGLNGTGDSSTISSQAYISTLKKLGLSIPSDVTLKSKSIALVTVTASLSSSMKPGMAFDVNVSKLENATRLLGGTLLETGLKDSVGRLVAVAQGQVSVEQMSLGDPQNASGLSNDVVRVLGGGLVKSTITTPFVRQDSTNLVLRLPDYSRARSIAASINGVFGPNVATALDATQIHITLPRDMSERVSYLSTIESLNIDSN